MRHLLVATLTVVCAVSLGQSAPLWAQQSAGNSPSSGQHSSSSKSQNNKGPSLDDTLAWLQNHISAMQVSFFRQEQHMQDLHVLSLNAGWTPQSMNSCNASISFHSEETDSWDQHLSDGTVNSGQFVKSIDTAQITISLGDIKESHVESPTKLDGHGGPIGVTADFQDSAVSAVVLTGGGSTFRGTFATTQTSSAHTAGPFSNPIVSPTLELATQDKDMAERIAKAFAHAAELCRAKEIF
jgi:hypothetical protein